ncbi:MAG TPA: sigma-54-dependent Fis family transcriptional regulator [Candidatus Latescibacteria bacterium]|nr:sigma-54-dependent Fis family transcriptional regulator [Candidatus Latescibacterota bacterium]
MSRILVIEDNETMRDGISQTLRNMGHEVIAVSGGPEGIKVCQNGGVDLVITDYKMQGMDGMQVLEQAKAIDGDIDVIMITAYGTIDLAVEAMKKGASDFVTKPFSPDELKIRVEKVLQFRQARQESRKLDEEVRYLRHQIDTLYNFGELVGSSERMRKVFERIKKVASSDSSVLIYGESGTGKELVARAIHSYSNRSKGPFVKVNCAALAEGILESELFGHEKGAFTGAIRRKKGKFELADGGSIFLDEIGDVPPTTQMRLLRVLQEREFDRVGGEETIKVDVRVIAATNKDLPAMVRGGKFREDLFYRLNVIPIELPPLRERKEDISELVHHFLKKKCTELGKRVLKIDPKAMEILMGYDWPGNVRELENVMERAIVLCDTDRIGANDLPVLVRNLEREHILKLPDKDLPLTEMLEDLERQLIERAFEKAKGVKTKAAKILGIKTSALYYKLEKYGMI